MKRELKSPHPPEHRQRPPRTLPTTNYEVSPALALSFLLNADEAVRLFPLPAVDPMTEADEIAAILAQLPADRLPALAVVLTQEVLALRPEAGGLLDGIGGQAQTRALDGASLAALLQALEENWMGVAILVVALRALGENRLKAGGLDLETRSIYQDLSGFLKVWGRSGDGSSQP
ncbi:hypothetical protein [Azospirillum largimobile]